MNISNKIFSVFQRDVILMAANILTGVAVARVLGPESLGIWMIMSLVPSYAEALGRTKSDVASIFYIGKNIYKLEDIIFNLNIIALISSVVIISVIYLKYEEIYFLMFNNRIYKYSPELIMLIIQIPLNFIYLNYSYVHIAIGNIAIHNNMTIINSCANSFITISLLIFTNIGFWSLIIGMEVAIILSTVYGIKKLNLLKLKMGKFSEIISINLIKYGFNFYLAGILSQLNETGTRLISTAILSPANIAFIGQGQILAQILSKFSGAINLILFPHICQSENIKSISISIKAFRILSILMIIIGLTLYIFSGILIEILYGNNFTPVVTVVYYIIPGVIISGLGGIFISYFNGTGKANLIPRLQAISVVFQLSIAYFFIERWGIVGASISISIGLIIYGVTVIILFIKCAKISWKLLIPKISDFIFLMNFFISKLKLKLLKI